MTSEQLVTSVETTFNRCLDILKRKNSDYASSNDALKNFSLCERMGICETSQGVLVRMADKFQRVVHLLDKPPDVANESLLDSLDDIINYAAILRAIGECCQNTPEKAQNAPGSTIYVQPISMYPRETSDAAYRFITSHTP